MLHTYGTSGNLFVGLGAGNFTLDATSISNVGFGRNVFKFLTLGMRNCGFGDAVFPALTSGNDNTIFGTFAGQGLTTASSNTAIGKDALKANATSIRNTAIGMSALGSCVGASNVAVGFNSAQALTGTAGSNGFNVCIGYGSGLQAQTVGGLTSVALTTATNNTMLGNYAGSTSATGTYRTAVGSDSICAVNNSIKLGRDHTPSVAGDMVTLPSVLTANLPTATAAMVGSILFVTDSPGGGHVYFCNGTSWARVN